MYIDAVTDERTLRAHRHILAVLDDEPNNATAARRLGVTAAQARQWRDHAEKYGRDRLLPGDIAHVIPERDNQVDPLGLPGHPAHVDWRHFSACRDEDPELFFPVGSTGPAAFQIEEAKAVCRRCLSMQTCLVFALEHNEVAGVWGGMSEDERKALKRREARNRNAA